MGDHVSVLLLLTRLFTLGAGLCDFSRDIPSSCGVYFGRSKKEQQCLVMSMSDAHNWRLFYCPTILAWIEFHSTYSRTSEHQSSHHSVTKEKEKEIKTRYDADTRESRE